MKRTFFIFFFSLVLLGYGFSQNNLTPDQIRRYAKELGVPYDDLQRFIDSHHVKTGLTNPNASEAQFLSIQEINFMLASNMLENGAYYRVQAVYFGQDGRSVTLYTEQNYVRDHIFGLDASFLVNIPRNTLVHTLIGVRAGQWENQELFLVEIVVVQ
jgi:hypothetical protein